MSENVFAPPESDLEDVTQEGSIYFSASPVKLAVMSLCTFGIYEIYWFYKNFVIMKQETQSSLMPFWRAFFSALWSYSLFKFLRERSEKEKLGASLDAGTLAVGYLVWKMSSALPDPFWLLSLLSFVVLLPANKLLTQLNEKAVDGFVQNKNFGGWNWFGIIVGGLFLLLAIVGTFLPPIEP